MGKHNSVTSKSHLLKLFFNIVTFTRKNWEHTFFSRTRPVTGKTFSRSWMWREAHGEFSSLIEFGIHAMLASCGNCKGNPSEHWAASCIPPLLHFGILWLLARFLGFRRRVLVECRYLKNGSYCIFNDTISYPTPRCVPNKFTQLKRENLMFSFLLPRIFRFHKISPKSPPQSTININNSPCGDCGFSHSLVGRCLVGFLPFHVRKMDWEKTFFV